MAGGREERVSDETIIRIFEEAEDPFLSTTEVADQLDYSQPGIRDRLYRLSDSGLLDTKETGGTRIWWLSEEFTSGNLGISNLESDDG